MTRCARQLLTQSTALCNAIETVIVTTVARMFTPDGDYLNDILDHLATTKATP